MENRKPRTPHPSSSGLTGRSRLTERPASHGQHPQSQKPPHLLLQQRHQLRLHEGVVVGDVEAHHAARFRCALNRRWSFARWARSMTKMMSAHSTSSAEHGSSASGASPAEAVSTPGRLANTCSAVGERRRLREQRKRRLAIGRPISSTEWPAPRASEPGKGHSDHRSG